MKLDVFLIRQEGYVVAWDDDGYAGTWLGYHRVGEDEHDRASQAAAAAVEPCAQTPCGYVWNERKDAMRALRAARAEVKIVRAEKAQRPWPEWAKTAAAEDWKPPRGWHP